MSLISKIYNSPHYLDEAGARKNENASEKPERFTWSRWAKARSIPKTRKKSTLHNKAVNRKDRNGL